MKSYYNHYSNKLKKSPMKFNNISSKENYQQPKAYYVKTFLRQFLFKPQSTKSDFSFTFYSFTSILLVCSQCSTQELISLLLVHKI